MSRAGGARRLAGDATDDRRRLLLGGVAAFVPGAVALGCIRWLASQAAPVWLVVAIGFVTALGYLAIMQALERIWFGAPSGTTAEAIVHLAFGVFWKVSFVLVLVAIAAVAGIPPRYMKPGGPTSLEPPLGAADAGALDR